MVVDHGGNRWRAASLYGLEPEAFLDFSANLNPLGPPPGLEAHLRRCLDEIGAYPEPHYLRLKAVLREHLRTEAEVVVGNGAVELIYLIPFLLRPRRVLVVEPGFVEYQAACRAAQAEVRSLVLDPAEGFALRPEALEAGLVGADMCFLGSPNNPTGNLPLASEPLIEAVKQHPDCLFVVDQSFVDFVAPPSAASLTGAAGRFPNLCIVYSLTKFFALPGLRLGCALAGPALARKLEENSPPWRVNALAARAGEWVLEQKSYMVHARSLVRAQREFLAHGLETLGLKPFPSVANFLLVYLGEKGPSGRELEEALGRRGLLIRRCASFTGLNDRFVRVAVRLPWENRRLLRALEEVLARGR
ncbi:MAG: threonine-phosphate decarboxylase CobD [Moorellales bacterium]